MSGGKLVMVRMLDTEAHRFKPGECPGHPIQGRVVRLLAGEELEVVKAIADTWITKGLAKRVAAKAAPKKVARTTAEVGEGGK